MMGREAGELMWAGWNGRQRARVSHLSWGAVPC